MTVAEAIKNLRMALCLQQKEFAALIDVTESSVCNWESGRRSPRLPKIRKMMELAKKNKIKFNSEDFLN
jgi:DNA-binding transcriptional regulator YiaG